MAQTGFTVWLRRPSQLSRETLLGIEACIGEHQKSTLGSLHVACHISLGFGTLGKQTFISMCLCVF